MDAILLLVRIFLSSNMTSGTPDAYICNNKTTNKYHYSSTCRGLSNCQYKIVKTTEQKATARGMTLCGWEKKK